MTTKIMVAAVSAIAAVSLFAQAENKREYPKTTKELAALPRLPTTKTPVPEDAGIYIGSGVYPNHGKMLTGGFCFTYWEPGTLDPTGAVELCVKEKVGNTLQFWRGNEILRDLCRLAKEKGLYSTCIYSRGERGIPHVITNELGATWLGYDFGEKFSFALDDWGDRGQTLETVAADYMKRVRAHVDKLHDMGWGNVMATSANFGLDIEVAAGVEIPCTEDFPFGFEGPEMDPYTEGYHLIGKNVIFFSKKRYELISAGCYWLSEDPVIAGSISWETNRARHANWVRVLDRKTGKQLRLIDIHLDHKSQSAKLNQAKLVVREAAQYQDSFPQIICADFNSKKSTDQIVHFTQNGWTDWYDVLHNGVEYGRTAHGFMGKNHPRAGHRIDYILTKGNAKALSCEIITDHRGEMYPSDHYFMLAEIVLE